MRKIFVGIALFSVTASSAQSWQDTVQSLDKIVKRYKDGSPGAQVAISRNGVIIYSVARGMADLEHLAPLTTTSKIEAGSVSKQFTAASILLLEQQGKLSLQDDIRKYLPEIRDYGHTIKIYHLLHHTSGLKDWGSVISLSGWPRGTRAYTNDDALFIISNQKTLNNKPGDEYIYSNSNYTAMTMIVQRVSGMIHAEFTKKNIFEPAGMTNTEWRNDYKRVVTGRAIAYSYSGKEYITNMPNEDTHGHGGLLTTAEDLLRWNIYYQSGKLGNPSLFPKQIETVPLNNGKRNVYAAGLVIDSINGWRAISHTGATASYRASLEYFPELELSFAWLSNTSEPDKSDISRAVRNLFVKNLLSALPASENSDSTISWKKFISYSGAYHNKKSGNGFRLYSKENGIYMIPNGGPLKPLTNLSLAVGSSKLLFPVSNPVAIGSGSLKFVTASGDTSLFTATDTARTDIVSLREYTGKYYSEETESNMYIIIENGKLIMYPRKSMEEELTPVYKDGFYYPGVEIWFERNKQGKLTHFYINVSRARKVEFRKIK